MPDGRDRITSSTARALYTAVLTLALPLVLARLWWRGIRDRDYRRRWLERLGRIPVRRGDAPCAWVHAVSVGEVQAARPFLALLERRFPGLDLHVSTTTPTGMRVLEAHRGDRIEHRYFPFDLPFCVRSYLDALRPDLVVLVETELWPNLIAECGRRSIPVAVVNARLSERSARGYRLAGTLTRELLAGCRLLATQTREDADRFAALGAPGDRLKVTGSIKFDARIGASVAEQGRALRHLIGASRPVLLAASTHPGEESIVLAAFAVLRESHPDLLLVLVPRHPERGAELAELAAQTGYQCARRSEHAAPSRDVDVYVGDTMGELPVLYAAADVAFVGGTLVDHGGHNFLEPAALGLPVLSGPSYFNFAEIARRLLACGAMTAVGDGTQLAARAGELLQDADRRAAQGEAGRRFVETNKGAVEALMRCVEPLLRDGGGEAA